MIDKHTPEPWKYGKELTSRHGEWLISMDAGDRGRGIPICETREASGQERANACRIVACVNACAGIPTEQLEQSHRNNAVTKLVEELLEVTKQCDDLLAALETLTFMCEVHGDFSNGVTDSTGSIDEGDVIAGEIISKARAAIASVKEKT